jgi:hypothetical protein
MFRMFRPRFRSFALLALLLTLFGSITPALAQEATPATDGGSAFAELGLPEIAVTITETAYEGAPTELEAGRYVLSVTNALEPVEGPFGPESAGAAFLQIPEEMTAEEVIAEVGPPAATPEAADAAASPMAEDGFMRPPPWYYETTLAGGPHALPGETRSAVIELTAGEWVLWAESPGAPQAPVPVTVSGDAPADQPAVSADLRIEMSEYTFTFPTPLTAGSHVIELANVGEQPHFIGMVRVPEGTTLDDVMALYEIFEAMAEDPMATPTGGLTFEDMDFVLHTAYQSPGVTAWYTAELERGTYLAVCFVPDVESGIPHAMLGMTQIVEVE